MGLIFFIYWLYGSFIGFCFWCIIWWNCWNGYRKVDAVMMRIAEIIYSIPYLLIVILLSVVFSTSGQGSSLFVMILAMSLTGWVPMALLVRGQVLQLKESEYVLAAESLGADHRWILKKHIIPNTLGPILVNVTLSIPRAIFAEATLIF